MELLRDGTLISLHETRAATMTDQALPLGMAGANSVNAKEPLVASKTIVLQPKCLHGKAGAAFQTNLEQAIEHAAVILVDLLWIDTTDAAMQALMCDAMKRAAHRGKSLSFLSLDAHSQQVLDQLWAQAMIDPSGDQQASFAPDFEQFLTDGLKRQSTTTLAVDLVSNRQW